MRTHAPKTLPSEHLRARTMLSRRTSGDQLYRILRDALSRLEAGARLPSERAISREYGVSRQMARSALNKLADEGGIERRRGSGSYAFGDRTPSMDGAATDAVHDAGLIDVIEMRRMFDPMIAELATARATKKDLAILDERIAELKQTRSSSEYKRASYKMLLAVAKCTRNPLLIASYQLLVDARESLGWGQLQDLSYTEALRKKRVANHVRLVEAIRSRSRAEAVSIVMESLRDLLEAALGPRHRSSVDIVVADMLSQEASAEEA
jgi:DNA-binding FadR family transcriptional regulator